MQLKIPNFPIQAQKPISQKCLRLGIMDFHAAVNFVHRLPYRRNSSKEDLTLVFSEKCGTCSSKHAALVQLALENDCHTIHLTCGIFKMNQKNTPGVGTVLDQNGLTYLPEAHIYMVYQKERIDITWEATAEESAFDCLLLEKELKPNQIGDFKVALHQSFLDHWRKENNLSFSLSTLWDIREQCIHALANL